MTSDARTAREASDANNAAMAKVLLALKGAGIEEKDYQTSRLSLQPQFAPSKVAERAPGIVSFRASNRVTVRIRDVSKVANVIDVLVGAGANDIGGINFTVTQASKHLDEAREKAIADHAARRRSTPRLRASRSASPSAFPRKARRCRCIAARWQRQWPLARRSRRARRRLRSR